MFVILVIGRWVVVVVVAVVIGGSGFVGSGIDEIENTK